MNDRVCENSLGALRDAASGLTAPQGERLVINFATQLIHAKAARSLSGAFAHSVVQVDNPAPNVQFERWS